MTKKALNTKDMDLSPEHDEELNRVINNEKEEKEEKEEKPTQAQILLSLAADVVLFHTPEGTCYATIETGGHCENWPVRSKQFRIYLVKLFYEASEKPPGSQALHDALSALEAKAYFDGQEIPVYTRLAGKDGKIYIDLCNETWQAVEISPGGWQVVSNPPMKFTRAKGMLPLPVPQEGGSIDELRSFINIDDKNNWRLLVAWMVAALRPDGPYPVMVLQGEQGSAKSTVAKVLRALLDPSTASLRTSPRDERDLAIAATNGWALAFDNISNIQPWLSDALCRVATGGGFATRTLYSDDEETLFDYMRPIVINGIDEIVTRHDLLDRSLMVSLPVIPEDKRKDEETFWREFDEAKGRILGSLLDAVAAGLRNKGRVELETLPRMADFAKWVTATEEALPWPVGGFMEAYAGNRDEAVDLALDADAVAVAVNKLIAEQSEFEGSATVLLDTLTQYVDEQTRKTKAWPKTARTMGNRVRRAATFLRQKGVEVEFYREGKAGKRLIRIKQNSSVSNVSNVSNPELTGDERLTQNGTLTQASSAGNLLSAQGNPPHGEADKADNTDGENHSLSNDEFTEVEL